jgi:hypothetical protein
MQVAGCANAAAPWPSARTDWWEAGSRLQRTPSGAKQKQAQPRTAGAAGLTAHRPHVTATPQYLVLMAADDDPLVNHSCMAPSHSFSVPFIIQAFALAPGLFILPQEYFAFETNFFRV